jgi:hypothetical protein
VRRRAAVVGAVACALRLAAVPAAGKPPPERRSSGGGAKFQAALLEMKADPAYGEAVRRAPTEAARAALLEYVETLRAAFGAAR